MVIDETCLEKKLELQRENLKMLFENQNLTNFLEDEDKGHSYELENEKEN